MKISYEAPTMFSKCETCEKREGELGVCPYSEELYGDTCTECNCCKVCRRNCADDI